MKDPLSTDLRLNWKAVRKVARFWTLLGIPLSLFFITITYTSKAAFGALLIYIFSALSWKLYKLECERP